MSIAIRINESIDNAAKMVAKGEFRSVLNQIESWAMVGKCALENHNLPIEFIKELITTKN